MITYIRSVIQWLRFGRGSKFRQWTAGYRGAYRGYSEFTMDTHPDFYAGNASGLLDRLVRR